MDKKNNTVKLILVLIVLNITVLIFKEQLTAFVAEIAGFLLDMK